MAKIEMELRPFMTPNFVLYESSPRPRQEGFQVEGPKIAIADVPADALAELCDQFRADVFRKAGKVDPRPRIVAACNTGGGNAT